MLTEKLGRERKRVDREAGWKWVKSTVRKRVSGASRIPMALVAEDSAESAVWRFETRTAPARNTQIAFNYLQGTGPPVNIAPTPPIDQ
jgi:hypothetical protein